MDSVLLIILGLPLVGSAVFVIVTFLLSWWVFPGGGSRGPNDTLASRILGTILLLAMEWLATVWVVMAMPLRFLQSTASSRKPSAALVPVAVLPGLLENVATMELFRRRLERALGVPVKTLKPVQYLTGLEVLALDYRRQIQAWMRVLGAEQVDLVGHSMGGLLARAMVESGELQGLVRSVITIGSPHSGSAMAILGFWVRSMRQMRRGSAYLEKLNSGSSPQGVRLVGICSTHDNLVLPWNCALSPRGDNFIVRYRGHLTLILSSEVVGLIAQELGSHPA